MSDNIDVVITIPKEIYDYIHNEHMAMRVCDSHKVAKAIANSTLLPKECDIQRIIPKRVDVQKWIDTKCPNPNCNCELSTHQGDGYYTIDLKPDFCPVCGQALLWEESEEKE